MKNNFTRFRSKNAAYLPACLLGLALWLMSALSLQAQTVYVTQEGAGQQTGADWANALPGSQLQATLASAAEGAEFRLAGGTYKPTNTTNRMLSFSIPSGVKVLGGYLGSGANPDQRMDFTNPDQPTSTTLSGDIDNDNQLDADNTNIVVQFTNVSTQTRLDGVVITGGYATTPIYFTNSIGGGAIYNNGYLTQYSVVAESSPTLQNCVFSQNYTSGMGGAVFNDGGLGRANPVFTNCRFISNRANQGGAVHNRAYGGDCSSTFINCSFLSNTAVDGGAMYNYAYGERQSALRGNASPYLINCVISTNTASTNGGAMVTNGEGAGDDYIIVFPHLINCSLVNNSASKGGAFYNIATPFTLNGTYLKVGPYLYNSILWNNGGTNSINNVKYKNNYGLSSGEGVVLFYNCLGEPGVNNAPNTDPKAQIISSSPFVSASNLQLNPCSPAINTGNTSYYTDRSSQQTDIAGNPRIVGGTIDMGAFEFQGSPAPLLAITQQPASQSTVVAGATVETTVGLNAPADSYAWYKEGLPVTGQTSASLRLTNVQPAQAGSYSLVATSACNSVTSTAFSLSVTPPVAQPPLVSAAANLSTLCLGSATNLTAQPTGGTAPYAYQWTSSQGSLSNPTASATSFTPTAAGTLSVNVVVTDVNNLTATTTLSLTVNDLPQPPSLLSQTGQAYPGGIASLTVAQNSGEVVLTVSGCEGGVINWPGGSASTLAVPTSTVGSFTYAASCQRAGCTSAAATATLVVTQPQPPAQRLAQLWLINADSNQPIQQLTSGLTIDLSKLPSRRINVQARTEPTTVGSVVFQLSGQQTRQQVETLAPYALFGDDNKGNYLPWTPAAGSYSLTATPYASAGGTGTAGTPLTVAFTVVDPVNPQRLAQLVLINADTDQPIQQLTNGQQLELSKLPTKHLAVQAVTDPTVVGSVVFALSGQQTHQQVETLAPYALFGDNQGHYSSWTPALGSYTLTATPYSGAGGTGSVGTALSVSFIVIESTTPAPQRLAQLVLINADTDKPIQQLTNGQQIDLSQLPTQHLAIQALTEPTTVGSVVFALSGRQSRQQVETIAPYALFGDDQGDFLSWTPALGSYTLTATPYSSVGGTGVAGTPLTVSFTVINPAAARLVAGGVELVAGWQVRLLGNPLVGDELVVEVLGAQDQALDYRLTTAGGAELAHGQWSAAAAVERQALPVGSTGAGMLLLQVSTPTRQQTLKVLKSH